MIFINFHTCTAAGGSLRCLAFGHSRAKGAKLLARSLSWRLLEGAKKNGPANGGNFDNFWARFFGFSIPTKKLAKQKHDLCMRKWWDRAENNNRNILAPGNPWFSFFPYSTFRGIFPAVLQNFVCPRRASPLWLLKVILLETAVTKVCIFLISRKIVDIVVVSSFLLVETRPNSNYRL